MTNLSLRRMEINLFIALLVVVLRYPAIVINGKAVAYGLTDPAEAPLTSCRSGMP